MAHSHGSNSDAEPNLVPLLDLVLQLIMFFMMCTHFAVMEQTDQAIKLPEAAQARPIPDEGLGPNVIYLGVTNDGEVKVAGHPPMTTDDEVNVFLRQAYAAAQERAKKEKEADVRTVVVIRADQNAEFAQVYKVMRRCQEAGLRKLQLRAVIQSGAPT
jgi:biopolymer transport protein ExbD